MELDLWAAVWAGLVAGMVMVAVRLALRAAGVDLRMDVARMWSTMFHVHGGAGRVLGMAMHLIVSVVVALVYAWAFSILNVTDALWVWGLVGGAVHWAIAGAFLMMAPAMNPEMPERIPAPGMFAARLGTSDVVGFLAGHLAYGVTFAILYGIFHPPPGTGL